MTTPNDDAPNDYDAQFAHPPAKPDAPAEPTGDAGVLADPFAWTDGVSWHKPAHRSVMANVALGSWMSAALDDPKVCDAMKADIREWFSAGEPMETLCQAIAALRSRPASDDAVERAIHAVAEIEMNREGTPYSRTQDEFYEDAAEVVNAAIAALRDDQVRGDGIVRQKVEALPTEPPAPAHHACGQSRSTTLLCPST